MTKNPVKKSGWRLYLFFAALLVMASCGPDPFYVRIASIEGVPETGTAGTPLALTGTVRPAFASNTHIIWIVKDAGTTGASISGNILNTEAVGTVKIRATVTDGKAEGKDYTQDFLINIVDGSGPPVTPDTYYDVTFDSNGGNQIPSQTVIENGKIGKPTDPYKSGYHFVGWYKESTLINPWNFDVDTVSGDITLYAKWAALYTVTFNANGGNTPASQIVEEGGYAARPSDPAKEGFSFDNWYSDSGLTTVYNFNTPVTGNITLYAKWIELITEISIEVTGPMKGETPNTAATANGTVSYTIGSVSWSPNDNPFKGSTQYKATVTITAKPGSKFTESLTAEINGHTAEISGRTDTVAVISHTFDPTLAKAVTYIEIESQPEKTTYTHGDTLDLSGLSVKLTYEDDSTGIFALENFGDLISENPANGSTLSHTAHNNQPVKVSIGSRSAYTNILTVNKATLTITFPTAAAITFGMTLSESALTGGSTQYGSFVWQDGATVPTVTNSGYPVEFTPTDTDNYDYTDVSGWNGAKVVRPVPITVNKADGWTVGTPVIAWNASLPGITVTPLGSPGSGQTVEYAKNTTNTAPESGWQEGTTFGDLSPDTTYYIFARSKANDNYNAGTASVSTTSIKFHAVTFNSNGGSTVATQYVLSGGKATEPANPTRSGFAFDGWYKETTFDTKWNFNDTVDGSITLYAKWVLSYTLTLTFEAISEQSPTLSSSVVISRTASNGYPKTYTMNVSNPNQYDSGSIIWDIPSYDTLSVITKTSSSITLDSMEFMVGKHYITLEVKKNGVPYNITITLEVRS